MNITKHKVAKIKSMARSFLEETDAFSRKDTHNPDSCLYVVQFYISRSRFRLQKDLIKSESGPVRILASDIEWMYLGLDSRVPVFIECDPMPTHDSGHFCTMMVMLQPSGVAEAELYIKLALEARKWDRKFTFAAFSTIGGADPMRNIFPFSSQEYPHNFLVA